jgi:hypothetical protein
VHLRGQLAVRAVGHRSRETSAVIVFGDGERSVLLAELVAELRTHARGAGGGLDELRRLVMAAGCAEQAVADSEHLHSALRAAAEGVTDAAAELFCAAWAGPGLPGGGAQAWRRLDESTRVLARHAGSASVRVRTPEGFAFYGLYPEQHCAAAEVWSSAHAGAAERRVLVVGVRSIGTTLSAVVRAALAARGWDAQRQTVRPGGPTTARTTRLEALPPPGSWSLVVDEGPGVSGSSMAAVAAALAERGVASDRIAFLPSHGGEPGSMASAATRSCWARSARHVVAPDELRWAGRPLAGVLADATEDRIAPGSSVCRIDDIGGGRWREVLGGPPREWPAIAVLFERAKYRAVLSDGRSLVWKFAGIQDELVHDALRERAARGLCAAPHGIAHGFVAVPWVEGTPLSAADGPRLVAAIAGHIAAVAGPPPDPHVGAQSLERLIEMLYWNVWEGLGPVQAERASAWSARALAAGGWSPPAIYGDGRMGPAEWRRVQDGRVRKVVGAGRERDHTVVGEQSVAWDVAGAIVEWDLTDVAGERLRRAVARALGRPLAVEAVRFHELAYAAFRLGLLTLARQVCAGDRAEAERSERAVARYRERVARLLAQPPRAPAGTPLPFTQRTNGPSGVNSTTVTDDVPISMRSRRSSGAPRQ